MATMHRHEIDIDAVMFEQDVVTITGGGTVTTIPVANANQVATSEESRDASPSSSIEYASGGHAY